jgi:site-specific recombinase XerC
MVEDCMRITVLFEPSSYLWEDEIEMDGWKNPIRKVKAPRATEKVLEPPRMDAIREMLDTCQPRAFTGERDKPIILALADAGVRAGELTAMNLDDLEMVTRSLTVELSTII